MEGERHIQLTPGQDPGEFRLHMDGMVIAINLKASPRSQTADTAGERSAMVSFRPPVLEAAPAAAGFSE